MIKKNILITGSSRGIGLELVKHYIKNDYNVIGISSGHSKYKHKKYEHFSLDLSKPQNIENFFLNFKSRFGHINHLINNAGIASSSSLLTISYESIQNVFSVNTISAIENIKFFSRHMIKEKYGRIVNITTTATEMNTQGQSAYIASKKALEFFSVGACSELSEYGITINNVSVSFFESDLNKKIQSKQKNTIKTKQKIKRICKAEDITNAVDFLLSEKSSFITGQTIKLAGF